MAEPADLVAEIEALEAKLAEAKASITRRFIGQERVVDLTLSALLCGGHGLLIGLPGLGKTRLVETLVDGDGAAWQPHPVHPRPDARRHPRLGGAGHRRRRQRARSASFRGRSSASC